MAEQGFNTGPNSMPGGAPEDPRVNAAAVSAELKQAQLLQSQTIKSLTETIDELKKQYADLVGENKTLSTEEQAVSKELTDKIQNLSEILKSMEESMAKGEPVRSLASIGAKERIQTFDKLTSVITQYQKSNLEFMKSSQGQSLDFDSWYEGFLEQQRSDLASLQASEDNGIVLDEIKKILKTSSGEMAKVSDPELTELARSSFRLSVDEKKRDLEFFEQNRDIIKLNKSANTQEQENVRKIISSNQFDPSKPILEHGFKSVSKDMDKLIQNTKHRSLIKIISDLLGPFGPIIMGLVKVVVIPLMFALGLFGGLLFAQYVKLKRIGDVLTLEPFHSFFRGVKEISDGFKAIRIQITRAIYQDLPDVYKAISDFYRVVSDFSKTMKGRILGALKSKFATVFSKFEMVPAFLSYLLDSLVVKFAESKIIAFIGKTGSILGSIGRGILNVTTTVGGFVKTVFAPITEFFKTGTGKLVTSVDYFTLGIFKFAKLGFKIGKTLGGLLGPLATVIGIFEGLPSLWQKLTSGDLRTAIKGALALITQITATTLATIFGGPVGGIAAAMALNFERIYRYFEPVFDLILDVGETIFDLISSIYTDFVQPVLETLTEVIVKLLDGAFTLLTPVLKLLRMVFTVMSYTIFPLVKLAFSALGFVFKYTFKALMLVYENTIEPVINGIAYVFNLVLDTITDVVKKIVEYAIGFYNDTLGKVFGEKQNPFDTAKAAVTEAATKTTEIVNKKVSAVAEKTTEMANEKAEDTKEWFGSLSDSVTEGVSDAISSGQQLGGSASESLNSLVDAMKNHTEAVKEQTVALSNSSLGMKIKEKGAEALDYMLTPMSNQMQYAASPSASPLSQQEMMNAALGYKTKAGDTIVNNVTNNTSGSGGGGGMIPMISSGHMDPTKVALQISYRPPG